MGGKELGRSLIYAGIAVLAWDSLSDKGKAKLIDAATEVIAGMGKELKERAELSKEDEACST